MDWIIQSKTGLPTTPPMTVFSWRLETSSVTLRSSSSAPPCLVEQCSMRPPRRHCWVGLPSERVLSERLQSEERPRL
jgi:hypothetical protein